MAAFYIELAVESEGTAILEMEFLIVDKTTDANFRVPAYRREYPRAFLSPADSANRQCALAMLFGAAMGKVKAKHIDAGLN